METTEELFRNWQRLIDDRIDRKEELEKIEQWLKDLDQNPEKEKYSEYVDTIIANQHKKNIKSAELDDVNKKIDVIENELKNRLKNSKSESIRIRSRQAQVMDSEIYIDDKGNLKSMGRM